MIRLGVAGSVNLDLVASVERLPCPGETVTGAALNRYPGGKGANQALAAQRLGAAVSLIARVGDDAAADEALALLRAGGVELSNCRTVAGVATGTALIAVDPAGENHIVVAPGANRKLAPDGLGDLDFDAMICQLEIPAETVAAVAARFEGFFCVNLAPAREVEQSVLERADLVVVNESEASWYGTELRSCRGLVAITRGGGPATLEKGGRRIAAADPPAVSPVDTTGAGDTFTAALTVALVEGREPSEALTFACTAAAIATTRRGAQPSLPTREEVIAHGQ